MPLAQRWLKRLFVFEASLATAAYGLMAGLVLLDVMLREFLGASIPGAQRLAVFLMILTGFLGLGMAAAMGRHFRPRFADTWFPAPWHGTIQRLGAIIMATVFAIAACYGVIFVMQAYEYGDLARSLNVPLWLMELIVPYAFASVALRYVFYAMWPTMTPREDNEA